MVIEENETLTINASQTIVWNPGYSVFVNGSIAINKSGGQLRKAYLWMKDVDNDGYPGDLTQIAAIESPGEDYVRRKDIIDIYSLDTNDNDSLAYMGSPCNGACTITYPDNSCGILAAGENNLPSCQYCDGTSPTPVYFSNNTQDAEGNNTCITTNYFCNGYGECILNPDMDNDGHLAISSGGDDCDDDCATCYPGSTEWTISVDDLDQDCDGSIDEQDVLEQKSCSGVGALALSAASAACSSWCAGRGYSLSSYTCSQYYYSDPEGGTSVWIEGGYNMSTCQGAGNGVLCSWAGCWYCTSAQPFVCSCKGYR
jgi:hypothetical protein